MILFLLKTYLKLNDLKTAKVVFYDVIGCSIWVYNFLFLKSSIKIFYIPNIFK